MFRGWRVPAAFGHRYSGSCKRVLHVRQAIGNELLTVSRILQDCDLHNGVLHGLGIVTVDAAKLSGAHRHHPAIPPVKFCQRGFLTRLCLQPRECCGWARSQITLSRMGETPATTCVRFSAASVKSFPSPFEQNPAQGRAGLCSALRRKRQR